MKSSRLDKRDATRTRRTPTSRSRVKRRRTRNIGSSPYVSSSSGSPSVAGAQGFVGGAVSIARMIGVSELVIGLTLVAVGTSLPELTVSVIATLRGQVDVAMGNVVGSNLCNLLLILGGTLSLLPQGISVQRQSAFVDLPVMAASAILVAWFAFTGRKVERWEGACLLAGQIGYAVYLVA